MGLADRDYMRQQPRHRPRWLPNLVGALIIIGLVALVVVVLQYRSAEASHAVVQASDVAMWVSQFGHH